MYALRNGRLIPEAEAVIPVNQREIFFNFSIYESLKVMQKKVLFVPEHLDRFLESAKILEMDHPYDVNTLRDYTQKVVDANTLEEATLKIQMIGGITPLLFMFLSPLPSYHPSCYSHGVKAITYPGERIFPQVKSNCLLLNYLAFREAESRGALDALLINRHGHITEGTRSNFYVFQGDTLITPGEDILFGVTRNIILEAAKAEGIPVRLEQISAERLLQGSYQEPFISSTSMGALPLAEIEGNIMGDSFPRVKKLHQRVKQKEAAEIQKLFTL